MNLLHVYGSMYQMGLAQGELLKEQLQSFIHELWGYIEEQVESGLPKKIPSFLKKGVSNFAIGTVLDLNYEITLPFTNKKYYEEMRGIADGSGVDFKYLKRIHMIGELTKGACSMFGAWGKATSNGQTVQLRALDWVQIRLCRISMVPITNSLLWWSIIPAVPSSAMPGSTSASWAGSVSFQA